MQESLSILLIFFSLKNSLIYSWLLEQCNIFNKTAKSTSTQNGYLKCGAKQRKGRRIATGRDEMLQKRLHSFFATLVDLLC